MVIMARENIVCINCEVSMVPRKCVYIQCEDCQKAGFDVNLCAPCFRMGAECGPHKRGHAYVVVDHKGPSLIHTKFGKQWGWKEDLKLIKAVQKYKLGNWEEIAMDLDSDKTAEDAKKRFDRFFIRGAFGRYASATKNWPYIDDRTTGQTSLPSFESDVSGQERATSSSDCRYIVEFFRNWEQPVDFNDPNWFANFERDLMKFRNEFSTSVPSSIVKKSDIDDQHSFEQRQDSLFVMTPPLSPISADDRSGRKRLLSLSDFDESDDEGTSNSESSNGYEYKAELATSVRKNSLEESYIDLSGGLQITDDEGSEVEELFGANKPILRLKRIGMKSRKKKNRNRLFLKEAYAGTLAIRINDSVKERLRELYPEHFYGNVPLLPFGAEERSRLKDDDLQMLAYMPEREDFEWEYSNNAERLISRLVMHSGNDTDEDDSFETAVKLAKVQKYNRILKLRKAKKAAVREYELVNKFFDIIKKTQETRRGVFNQQQSFTLARRHERFHSLMKRTYQVARKSELEQLLDAVTCYVTLNERIFDLESLKADGIKTLKGRGRVGEVSDHWKSKRKRRPPHLNEQRKAHLRWKRFKQWAIQQASECGSVESDV